MMIWLWTFFARFVNSVGKCFSSLSYTRIGNNLGECVFQLSDMRFFRVETYFSKSDRSFAVGKAAKNVREIYPAGVTNGFGFFFELSAFDSLEVISTDKIEFKTVVLIQENEIFISVMSEGFEHN